MNVPEIFGTLVFNDAMMKKYLPEQIYVSLKNTASKGERLDPHIADEVTKYVNAVSDELGVKCLSLCEAGELVEIVGEEIDETYYEEVLKMMGVV